MKNSVPIVWMKGISKVYRSEGVETVALRNINLTINKGEFIAITGRSGSGKSTLMHLIGLLDTPTSGAYKLNGVDVSKLDEDSLASQRNVEIGFVFQSFNLLPRATSLENVTLPAIYAGVSEEERLERATKLLTEIGLEDQLNKRPNQMSGGQQQRVAIARALMNDPELILADEPTGNLDTKSGEDVMNTLKKLNKDDKTIVLITHEKDIANQAKRMLHLEDGEIK
ncbi:MAG: macrolide ABC transporter ATP-binding protein [Candidatus Levybacteria bacterium RIFOXYA1_FULL_41_10]|nr:MAG: putative ABC-type transport system, ATPase component [Candidatus Levybacteria bacterium GW2011_GWA1_39_34]KKR71286.1 MAG: putative ABC-type transport system, ATPase component [Candidatus Levybacteria bacterium GW2011_GWC2_40_7]KKR94780.1 MAG: putative ABC-type transport system, ATPase component [Candidatus Levybacteria bacterium GW2011_GWA2_41_15]OGH21158.1 MAG: macrolide ABC transporter ATP-binding protein [Candidatus Levybacteria bacterium RIFCSPHIGHO2_01_FULL_40_83]OGH27425.1 MAG: ma